MLSRRALSFAQTSRAPSAASTKTAPKQHSRGMASVQDMEKRIASVSSIRKITSSMKMVAAAKLKHAEKTLKETRPFLVGVKKSAAGILAPAEEDEAQGSSGPTKQKLVMVTSDRGLCGALNSGLAKLARNRITRNEGADQQLFILGDKGRNALERDLNHIFDTTVQELGKRPPTFADMEPIATAITDPESSDFEKLVLSYNHFLSVLANEATEVVFDSPKSLEEAEHLLAYEIEGDQNELLNDLYQFQIAATLYGAIVENATAELGARMTSMDNATTNAGEMIDALTLKKNRLRQSNITTELTEIISGAESLNSGEE